MTTIWLYILELGLFSAIKAELMDADVFSDAGIETEELSTTCTKGWIPYGNKCYGSGGKRDIGRIPWNEASERCKEYGGQLATVNSKDLEHFLMAFILIDIKANVWIGLHDKNKEFDFEWEDGTPYNYTNWGPDEPIGFDGDIQEDCVEMWFRSYDDKPTGKPGQWNDLTCKQNLDYICQERRRRSGKKYPDPRFCSPDIGGGWRHDSSCYHIVRQNLTWSKAENYCIKRHNGHLVTIKDFAIDIFLHYILKTYSEVMWIGIKIKDEAQQKWTSGWLLAYTKWIDDNVELNDGPCAVRTANGSWTTAYCNKPMPFICETSTVTPLTLKSPPDLFCPDEPRGWRDLGGDFCYYFDFTHHVTWSKANFMCRRRGGFLASIHSQEELEILHQFLIYKEVVYWIGLHRSMLYDDEFVWVDGTPLDFEHWGEGEPNSEKEQCSEVRSFNMGWNDRDCDHVEGFICSIKKVAPNRTSDIALVTEAGSCGFSIDSLVGVFACVMLVSALLGIIIYYLRPNQRDQEIARKTYKQSTPPIVRLQIPK